MAKVEIEESLKEEIFKKFKGESRDILNLMYSLENNPKKGKFLAEVAGVAIKELKYKSFRFYFVANNYQLRILSVEKLKELMIKFVKMSDKKHQQETIEKIKDILRKFGENDFH